MAEKTPFAGLLHHDVLTQMLARGGITSLADLAGPVLERAYAADPAGAGSLNDIEHIVLLMQENRSFDHYYGTLSGVRGFDDVSDAFRQYGYQPGVGVTPSGYLNPFRLAPKHCAALDGEEVNDPTHDWGPQHLVWNQGRMDQWLPTHIARNGPENGPVTMGYYTREDLPVHHALADAFTICDQYFSSVMGPTNPNRLYWMTGTIDPDGRAGGPLLETPLNPPEGVYSWRTYPEQLEEAGVSWKVYESKSLEFLARRFLSSLMRQFKAYGDPETELARRALEPGFPDDFRADVANGTLPSVSWIVPSMLTCEHAAMPPAEGAVGIMRVLDILTSNPAVWEKTALIVSYDENGGFFDHVPPPTAPPGTPGEYVTVPLAGVAESENTAGPIGLGFRVPCLVISPFSRGGLVSSDVFDHTSQLRLLERRFGVPVPNLTDWRRRTVGDLTAAFDFGRAPGDTPPPLPSGRLAALRSLIDGNLQLLLDTRDLGPHYPVPPNAMPTQETTPPRGRPSGLPPTA